jgi:hypothetical protein
MCEEHAEHRPTTATEEERQRLLLDWEGQLVGWGA